MQGDAREYSPLTLAWVGDAVFELFIREAVAHRGNMPVDRLNRKARGYVNAGAQARMYFNILESLSDEETAVVKRGRNARAYTRAKNAGVLDYRRATGLEALFGYLYMKGETQRLNELMEQCVKGEDDGQE